MTPISVLLVDDQPHVLRLLTTLIADDHRLTLAGTATNGLSGLVAAQRMRPEAIVCDIRMPVMDGLQALPRLRQTCPDSVIVVYSSDTAAASGALQEGADAVFDKAHDASLLLDRLVELCQQGR